MLGFKDAIFIQQCTFSSNLHLLHRVLKIRITNENRTSFDCFNHFQNDRINFPVENIFFNSFHDNRKQKKSDDRDRKKN